MSRRSRRASFGAFDFLKSKTALITIGVGLVLLAFSASGSVFLPPTQGSRDPQSITDAVAQVNPAGAPDLQPNYLGQGNTWCNAFISRVLDLLGIYMPGPPTTKVNQQIQYMQAGNGWTVTDAQGAQQAALTGSVAVATYFNPDPYGHGHIALVLPIDGPVLWSAQAGAQNWNAGPLLYAFGNLPVVYFTHA